MDNIYLTHFNMSEEVNEIEEEPKEEIEKQSETVEEVTKEHEVSCSIREPINETGKEIKEVPTIEAKEIVKEEKKPKTITCNKCNKTMLLRSCKYKHERNCQGKAEDRTEVKRQAKPKAKAKITAKPIVNQVVEEEPVYFQEVKEKVKQQQIHTPQQPPMNPMTSILDNYKLIHQEYLNKKREKTNVLICLVVV